MGVSTPPIRPVKPIRVDVEHVVFEGLSPAEARAATASFRAELQRLLETGGVPDAWNAAGARPVLRLNASWAPGSRPAEIGRGLARGIVQGDER